MMIALQPIASQIKYWKEVYNMGIFASISSYFTGKRTYMTIGFMVVTGLLGLLEFGGATILSPEVTAGLVAVLGAFAVYFRREATR